MNFAIRYLTEYRYDRDVTDNLNALRVSPASTARQRVDELSVRIDPETRLHRHADYFGTEVVEFAVTEPHDRLTIDVRARVATTPPPAAPEAEWEALRERGYLEPAGEFLIRNGARGDSRLDALHETTRARTPLATVLLVGELVPDSFEYRPGVTYVGSTIADLLDVGAGVCQDFVHLALELLRRRGIAARYVSGYLFASHGDESESIEVATHAWVEALLPVEGNGEGPVWVGVDPTNRGLTGDCHVKIGHGRHYADVPPTKGVYRGAAEAALDASVRMTRTSGLDPAATARA